MVMLAADVATNFAEVEVTVSAGLAWTALVRVSTVLAVVYVLKYRAKINRNGFEARKACGRVAAGMTDRRRQDQNGCPVDAFSTMDLAWEG